MDSFTEISAKIHPPNPLFGRLWKSLKDYIDKRNASELSLKETAPTGGTLDSNIANLMSGLSQDSSYVPDTSPDITDAALLMAADGYGNGKVVGIQNGTSRVIKTAEAKKSFRSDKEPDPVVLAQVATEQFRNISRERDMDH